MSTNKGMQDMPNMLAYTVRSSNYSNIMPYVVIGMGRNAGNLKPDAPQDNSIWIAIFDSMNPKNKVKEFIIPGANNTAVPAGLDSFMSNPQYLFVLATQYLSTLNVPQGALYDYLVNYGAGRELQRIEQASSVLGCGVFSRMNYILTGPCGPRNKPPKPTTYEVGDINGQSLLMMSLMPQPNGQPPYSLCNNYTFQH